MKKMVFLLMAASAALAACGGVPPEQTDVQQEAVLQPLKMFAEKGLQIANSPQTGKVYDSDGSAGSPMPPTPLIQAITVAGGSATMTGHYSLITHQASMGLTSSQYTALYTKLHSAAIIPEDYVYIDLKYDDTTCVSNICTVTYFQPNLVQCPGTDLSMCPMPF